MKKWGLIVYIFIILFVFYIGFDTLKENENSISVSNDIVKYNSFRKMENDIILSNYDFDEDYVSMARSNVVENKLLAHDVIYYTNEYRNELGVSDLEYDEDLSIAATIRAIEIALNDKFEHIRPNGLSYSSVLKDLGIKVRCSAENIAFGYSSSSRVVNAWAKSEGHYINMVNEKYNKVGIGYFEYNNVIYWSQMFSN